MNQILEIIRIVFGSIYVLFLPGYVLSFLFMKAKTVDLIERIALSFALSISVVPLVAFYLNLLGVRISTISVVLEILGIILLGAAGLYFMNLKSTAHDSSI